MVRKPRRGDRAEPAAQGVEVEPLDLGAIGKDPCAPEVQGESMVSRARFFRSNPKWRRQAELSMAMSWSMWWPTITTSRARRMAETAAQLVDHVIPRVNVAPMGIVVSDPASLSVSPQNAPTLGVLGRWMTWETSIL